MTSHNHSPAHTGKTGHPAAAQQPTATETGIEAEFTGWHVWRTHDAGTWWASRRGPGWNTEPRTLAADTAEGLRAELHAAHTTTREQQ